MCLQCTLATVINRYNVRYKARYTAPYNVRCNVRYNVRYIVRYNVLDNVPVSHSVMSISSTAMSLSYLAPLSASQTT